MSKYIIAKSCSNDEEVLVSIDHIEYVEKHSYDDGATIVMDDAMGSFSNYPSYCELKKLLLEENK